MGPGRHLIVDRRGLSTDPVGAKPDEFQGPTLIMRGWTIKYLRRGLLVVPMDIAVGYEVSCSCGSRGCTSIGKHPRSAYACNDATSDAANGEPV